MIPRPQEHWCSGGHRGWSGGRGGTAAIGVLRVAIFLQVAAAATIVGIAIAAKAALLGLVPATSASVSYYKMPVGRFTRTNAQVTARHLGERRDIRSTFIK